MTADPGAPSDITDASVVLHGCRCDEGVVQRLIRTVSGRESSAGVTLEAYWNETRLVRHSLADIKSAIRQLPNPGNPNLLDRLQIISIHADRRVIVDLGLEAAAVTVEAADSAWARGTAHLIREILENVGGRSRRQKWQPWASAVASGFAVAGIFVALWTIGLATIAVWAIALVVGVAAISYLLARWMLGRSRPIIFIGESLPRRGWGEWNVGDRIAFLALLVAICGVVAPLIIH